MADAPINMSVGEIGKEVGKSIINSLPPEVSSSLGFFIHILEAVSIVVLIYVIFLIVKAVLAMKTNSRIKKISENVEEINKNLDILVNKGKKLKVPRNK